MEDVEHSPLLKLVVGDINTPTMSKPEFKIKVPVGDSKITSTVIGEQKLRESISDSNFAKATPNLEIEGTIGFAELSSENAKLENQEEEKKIAEAETHDAEIAVEDSENFVLSPVITVTKEEAAFTKGDLKLQKVTVSEDISDPKSATSGELSVNQGDHDIHTEVLNVQQIRMEKPKEEQEKEKTESKKPKTRIPTLRFRQAVDQLRQSRKSFEDKKEPETPQPTPRSAIPRLKDNKCLAPGAPTPLKETNNALPRLSDEFDKLYDEIAEDQDSLDNISLSSRIEDPEKLENTFEEIIHAYEENNIEPINIEKVRHSKIPLLKRKSEHELEIPKHITPELKQCVSVDFSKIKSSEIITENNSKIQSVTLNKSPIRTSIISKRISEMKSVDESSPGYFEKISTVNVPTIEKSNSTLEPNIMKKEVEQEALNRPSNVNKNEENVTRTDEKKTSTITTPTSEYSIENIKSVEKQNIFNQKEKPFKSEASVKSTVNELNNEEGPNNEEEITLLRGKVNRIIQRMDSKETEAKKSKKDLGDGKPREKTVLSKIALFEHPKSGSNETQPKNVRRAQSYNNKPVEYVNNKSEPSKDKPKIVEKVLKEFPAENVEKYNKVENENNVKILKTISNNNNAPISVVDRQDNKYVSNEKLTDVRPQIDIQYNRSSDPAEIPVLNTNNFSSTPIKSELRVPDAACNSKDINENSQSPTLNINDSKDEQEKVCRQLYDEQVDINGTSEIKSDIIKQKVKYDRIKINNKGNTKENEDVSYKNSRKDENQLRINLSKNHELDTITKSSSLAELDLGFAVQSRVKNIIVRMKSLERLDAGKKEIIDARERPRKKSVSEKIALFEKKLTPTKLDKNYTPKTESRKAIQKSGLSEEEYAKKIEELSLAKTKYGALDQGKMKYLEFRDGGKMPAIGIGTALLDPRLTRYIVQAAIDLGYRTIDTAYIYGNEKEVGEAINEKIKDGTVSRSELFIISKLWSTFHRQDLVERACRTSLDAMGLDYFDLYLIHNPMSFKEGGDPIPRIASVIQFSEHDYMDAWFGVETLVRKGLVRRGGVSNFNSQQLDRVVEKGKIKPVVNQVECHPYLSQNRLDDFCQARHVKLCCFGVLGSKGTPQEFKSALPPAIDDPLVRVMAAGMDVSPATLLVSYQLALDRGVIVKASSPAHLWDNLQALTLAPSPADMSALHALNRNKRNFTFKGMGDTHRNYPFNIPF